MQNYFTLDINRYKALSVSSSDQNGRHSPKSLIFHTDQRSKDSSKRDQRCNELRSSPTIASGSPRTACFRRQGHRWWEEGDLESPFPKERLTVIERLAVPKLLASQLFNAVPPPVPVLAFHRDPDFFSPSPSPRSPLLSVTPFLSFSVNLSSPGIEAPPTPTQ